MQQHWYLKGNHGYRSQVMNRPLFARNLPASQPANTTPRQSVSQNQANHPTTNRNAFVYPSFTRLPANLTQGNKGGIISLLYEDLSLSDFTQQCAWANSTSVAASVAVAVIVSAPLAGLGAVVAVQVDALVLMLLPGSCELFLLIFLPLSNTRGEFE